MGKSTAKDEEPVAAQASAPKKAKGLTKKRGHKDRFAAEANTQKNKERRAATIERRVQKHRAKLAACAKRAK